jgi:broad specificity phosphatase PhoE
MRLVIVRHGETVENSEGVIQGQLPGRLNEKGKRQSEELALKLKDEKFDQVWSSDLQRCVDTANFLLEYHPGLKLQVAPDLREIKYGNLQGKKATDIEWDEIESADLNQKYPGGESNMEMAGRVLGFLNELLAKFPDQSILIVTHGGPMRVIRAAHDKLPLEQIFNRDIVNTAIFDFDLKTPLEIRLSK